MSSGSTNPAPLVMLADDDVHFLRLMEYHLKSWGFRVATAVDKHALYRVLCEEIPSLLFLDVRLGTQDGVELLGPLLDLNPNLNIVMMTAHGSIDNAVAAIRLGARDYVTKPVDLERLHGTINHLLDHARPAKGRPDRTGTQPDGSPAALTRPILGNSTATRLLIEQIKNIAATDATVMVLGESGSGKELVARAIHEMSTRRNGPFVALNVAALPRELVESTLFGHEKGAFTGAEKAQAGCCQAADHGTLFLDEIGEMELGLQAKLLRFLQERKIQRVGKSEPIAVDVRIVTATNREPLEQVKLGRLREDLYYRLNVVPIRVPPLRARSADIKTLAEHFLQAALARYRRPSKSFSPEAIQALEGFDWPGNVRQLENVVERLAILVAGDEIQVNDVRAHLQDDQQQRPGRSLGDSTSDSGDLNEPVSIDSEGISEFEKIEKQAIIDSLDRCGGSVREAAKRLGIAQATIYRKLKKYRITS